MERRELTIRQLVIADVWRRGDWVIVGNDTGCDV